MKEEKFLEKDWRPPDENRILDIRESGDENTSCGE